MEHENWDPAEDFYNEVDMVVRNLEQQFDEVEKMQDFDFVDGKDKAQDILASATERLRDAISELKSLRDR